MAAHASQPSSPHRRTDAPLPAALRLLLNPLEMAAVSSELLTAEWIDVFQQAGKLGMLHAHFTGGEPLARADLTELIAGARTAGLYTNLITSGIGLARIEIAGSRQCRAGSHTDQLSGFARRCGQLDRRRESARA